jgi:hypothetical protein
MGVAIEIANAIVKVYVEQKENIFRVQKQNAMRVSQIQGLDYSLSYIMASSTAGSQKVEGGVAPMDIAVKVNIDLKQFPKVVAPHEEAEANDSVKSVKMAMTRDKFLQFTRDMKQALSLLE